MIIVLNYYVVNGDKSQPFEFKKVLKDKEELEELRKELEELHECWQTVNFERKHVKDILFTYSF